MQGISTASTDLTLAELYRRAAPGVVEITTRAQGTDVFGAPQEGGATGSGFVIDEQGRIVTNHHVVEATSVSVRFANGDEAQARIVGSDLSTDVALLKLEGSRNVTPLPLGSTETLEVGDAVAAIGSPFGLEGTLTSGIVARSTATSRRPTASGSAARSRRTRRSTRATPAARCSTGRAASWG